MQMRRLSTVLSTLVLAFVLMTSLAVGAQAESVLFLSTQLRPIEEAQKMRDAVLAGYSGDIEFIPVEPVPFVDRVLAEQRAGRVSIGLLGGVHGDFPALLEARALDNAQSFVCGYAPVFLQC